MMKNLKKLLCFMIGMGTLYACSQMKTKDADSGMGSENAELKVSIDVKERTLSNGLKILVVENHKLPIFSYYTYFKVGGKYESPGITGSSHLLEHMMFKGGKKYGDKVFDKLVEGNGGRNNAYTTNDLTVYYQSLPSEHFEVMADLEADRMQNLLLQKDSFEKERKVVLEERRMRYENSDRGKLYLKMMKEVFKGTPYGLSVIGTVPDLKTVSRDQVWDYFKKYYAPNNAVIVIVGNVKADDVFDTIEKKFGEIAAVKGLEETKKKHIESMGYNFRKDFKQRIKLKGDSPTPTFTLAYKGLAIGSREAFALDLLSSMLGDGESSYFNQRFVSAKKATLLKIYAANYTLQDSGVLFIGGQLLEKVNLKTFEKKLRSEIKASCENGISARALQKVLNQYMVSNLTGLDTNEGIARFIGDKEVYYGDYNFYKKEMSIYNSITIDEVRDVCRKYLATDENMLITIWNKH